MQWTEGLQGLFIAFLEAMASLLLIFTPLNVYIYIRYFGKQVILDILQNQMHNKNVKTLLFAPMTLDKKSLKLYFQ